MTAIRLNHPKLLYIPTAVSSPGSHGHIRVPKLRRYSRELRCETKQSPRVIPILLRIQPRERAAARGMPRGARLSVRRHNPRTSRAAPWSRQRKRKLPRPDRRRRLLLLSAAHVTPLPVEEGRVEVDPVLLLHPRVHVLPERQEVPQVRLPQPALAREPQRALDLPQRRVHVPVQAVLAGGVLDLCGTSRRSLCHLLYLLWVAADQSWSEFFKECGTAWLVVLCVRFQWRWLWVERGLELLLPQFLELPDELVLEGLADLPSSAFGAGVCLADWCVGATVRSRSLRGVSANLLFFFV